MDQTPQQPPNKYGKYQCPCCKYYTFDLPVDNTFDICPVCYWADDGVQLYDPSYAGGANSMSLIEARENFKKHQAKDLNRKAFVRRPTKEELADVVQLYHHPAYLTKKQGAVLDNLM